MRRGSAGIAWLCAALLLGFAAAALAQSERGNPDREISGLTAEELSKLASAAPLPGDVESPRAVVLALHTSLSGPMASLDWQRFRSLFLPGARIGEAGTENQGAPEVSLQSVDAWVRSVKSQEVSGTNRETPFKMRVEQFGNVANVFFSHSSVFVDKNNVVDVRRVDDCQMLFDGRRWWITSLVWNDNPKQWNIPSDMEP